MIRDVDRASLYNAPINLWVEDALTRSYLGSLWQNDPSVKFLIGGGHRGVAAIVEDARQVGYTNVFGLVDRDFGESNFAKWSDPSSDIRVFVLPVFEIENYLLDGAALVGCPVAAKGLLATTIDQKLVERTLELLDWVSICRVVFDLSRQAGEEFPRYPSQNAFSSQNPSHVDPVDWLLQTDWVRQTLPALCQINEESLRKRYENSLRSARSHRTDDRWRREFPGKEILRHVRGIVYPGKTGTSIASLEQDLAKSVAEWQVTEDNVPNDLTDLLTALKQRAGV